MRGRLPPGSLNDVRGRMLLAGTMLTAIVITAATMTTLIMIEPAASKAEALKTGGLAGGAVIALYALWLNDRRRRTEEARHELESDKVADERFARSVELLGNAADDTDPRAFHLDLTGATLENFRLQGRRIGRLIAPHARFHGIAALGQLHATKPVLLTSAVFEGRFDLHHAQLAGGLSLHDATFTGEVTITGAAVGTFLDVRTTPPTSLTGTLTVTDDTARIDGDPTPWIRGPEATAW